MYYYIYKITNNINNKIYIGVHKTKHLDDGYMGSGKIIKAAIQKYGIENFTKDILEYFDDASAMFSREKEIVTEDFLSRSDTYNIRRGGYGGFDYINSNYDVEQRKENGKKVAEFFWNDPYCVENHKKRNSERFVKLHEDGKIKYDTFTGKNHSDESKLKISNSHKIRNQDGIKPWNYGKQMAWIHQGEIIKIIPIEEVKSYLDNGWFIGKKDKQPKEKVIIDRRKNWKDVECANCGIVFKACPRDIRKNRKFCSIGCCGKYNSKNR